METANSKLPSSMYMKIAQLKHVGARYYGMVGRCEIEVELSMKGSGCCFRLPCDKIPTLVSMFPDVSADEFWLSSLEGKFLLAYFDPDRRICGVAELQDESNCMEV